MLPKSLKERIGLTSLKEKLNREDVVAPPDEESGNSETVKQPKLKTKGRRKKADKQNNE